MVRRQCADSARPLGSYRRDIDMLSKDFGITSREDSSIGPRFDVPWGMNRPIVPEKFLLEHYLNAFQTVHGSRPRFRRMLVVRHVQYFRGSGPAKRRHAVRGTCRRPMKPGLGMPPSTRDSDRVELLRAIRHVYVGGGESEFHGLQVCPLLVDPVLDRLGILDCSPVPSLFGEVGLG